MNVAQGAWNISTVPPGPRVIFERVHALVASINGPGGRAEVRFLCNASRNVRFVVRIEAKRFQEMNVCETDIVLEGTPQFTLEQAIEVAKDRVSMAPDPKEIQNGGS